jgi:hypothetical protein
MTVGTEGHIRRSLSLVELLAAAALMAAVLVAVSAQADTPPTPHRHLTHQVPRFAIVSVVPPAGIQAGHSGAASVTINRTGGHTAAITLSLESNASGITGSGSIAVAASSGTLDISVPSNTSTGMTALTLDASDGSASHTAPFNLTVTVATGNTTMSDRRAYHSETLLPDGRVLLAGGMKVLLTYTIAATADLYDPASGLLNPTGSLGTARWGHTATLLANGKVLIAGGFINKTDGTTAAELFDPNTGTFSPTAGALHHARGGHTATLLPSGDVLIVGGYSGKTDDLSHYPAVCEIYSPTSNSFRDAGSLNAVRGAHRATPIFSATFPAAGPAAVHAAAVENRVLISGGYSANGILKSLEWYYVATDSFATVSVSLATGRALHTAVLLPNNTVLFAGGGTSSSLPPSATSTAELYTIASNSVAPTGSLNTARAAQTATLVGSRVLVFGGVAGYTVFKSVESYDPGAGAFTTLATAATTERGFHTGTLLGNGKVLLAGGLNISASNFVLNTLELYTPPAP